MYVLGLTGPMASGKSTVAQMFREAGAEVWDADVAVHHLYDKNKGLQGELVALLGDDVWDTLMPKERLNRSKRVGKIRENPDLLAKIEEIVFPYLVPAWLKWVKQRKSQLLILEAPLLFEAELAKYCNTIVTCAAPEDVRKERALARNNVDEVWWNLVTAQQMTAEDYAAQSDRVLDCVEMEVPRAFVDEMKQKYLDI